MQFTREPIIETIITPKDGYRLVLRPTKSGGEEFFVDMVEVVTFGHATFYRSLDKPKSFVVPVSDYDVVEVREARMAIKSATVEKVKIAGGKKEEEEKSDKKSGRKRTRKKKPSDEQPRAESPKETPKEVSPPKEQREPRPLIPPPPTLISESMAKAKEEAAKTPVEVADE